MQSGPCGQLGQPCCPSSLLRNSQFCPDGRNLRCTSATGAGRCEACGGTGEPCCQREPNDDPSCDLGNVCADDICRPCGDLGERCCPSSLSGTRNSLFCPTGRGLRCSSASGNGRCEACGGAGEPCCQLNDKSPPSCIAGKVCNAGACEPCGERGERCCSSTLDGNIGYCPSGTTLRCSSDTGDGFCLSCGGFGERCCQKTLTSTPTCDSGTVCNGNGCCGTASCPADTIAGPVSTAGADLCPDDPSKSSPGRCGCGVPETPTCGLPDTADGSEGVNAIGVALDASGSLTEADFLLLREQVRDPKRELFVSVWVWCDSQKLFHLSCSVVGGRASPAGVLSSTLLGSIF